MTASHPFRFALSALVVGLAVVALAAAPAVAQRGATSALATLAAQPARLAETLKRTHASVNQALKIRGTRLASYQSALKRRERAAGRVEQLRSAETGKIVLKQAMREALVLDEEAQRARAALLKAEAKVARLGARLLEVFDLVLAEKGRLVSGMNAGDSRRDKAVRQYRNLAKQRAQIRKLLQPVLGGDTSGGDASLDEVRAASEDDVETLLEKADLARDLEERFLRRADEVRRRIQQLQQEASLARKTQQTVAEQSMFGESDYRPVFGGGAQGAGPGVPGAGSASGFRVAPGLASAGGGAPMADQNAPPSSANVEVMPPADQYAGDGDAEAEPAEPTPPPGADPGTGFTNDDADGDDRAGEDVTAGGGLDVTPNTGASEVGGGFASRGTGTQPSSQFSGLPTEQVYLGPGAGSDARLRELIASDDLTMAQLKRLEKKLRGEARTMRRENKQIQTRLKGELKRRP